MAASDTFEAKAVSIAPSEDFLHSLSLLDKAGDGIYVLESESGRILYANEIAAQMLDYSRDELLHLSAADIEVALSPAAISASHQRTQWGVVPVEGVHRRKDGSTVPVEIRLTSLAPQWPGLLLAIVRDITKRKQAEEKIRESEERYQLALWGTNDGIWDWNPSTNEVYISDRLSELLGFQPGELAQSFQGWESQLHPEDRRMVFSQLEKHLRDGTPYDLECRLRTKTGNYRWFRDRGKAIRDTTGKPVRMAGVISDITERKRLEVSRERDARRKDEFLALLAHELRNPLAAISYATQLLSTKVTDKQRASIEETISRELNLLRRLVDDLLDLARITHGQIILQKGRIDLTAFMQRVAATARPLFTEREQELVVRLSSSLAFLADGIRMEQIAVNLLSNASKYTGRKGRIEFSGGREGSDVVIRCKDNGQGIPPEEQAKIFGPFTRGQRANSFGEASLGIGLTLVKQLTKLHGGTVSVNSGGPGMGSEFVVRLPLVKPPPVPRAQRETVSISPSRRPVSILIVEDNPDVARTMAASMEQLGHKVIHFADGSSALSGLAGSKPDVALIDIGLPGMDGYELAAKLKKRRNLRRTLFIGLSGVKKRFESRKTSGIFDYYLVKPVDFTELLKLFDSRPCAGAIASPARTRKTTNPDASLRARKRRKCR